MNEQVIESYRNVFIALMKKFCGFELFLENPTILLTEERIAFLKRTLGEEYFGYNSADWERLKGTKCYMDNGYTSEQFDNEYIKGNKFLEPCDLNLYDYNLPFIIAEHIMNYIMYNKKFEDDDGTACKVAVYLLNGGNIDELISNVAKSIPLSHTKIIAYEN